MILKFIDIDHKTHFIEGTEVTFLGGEEIGLERAKGMDGPDAIVFYDSGFSSEMVRDSISAAIAEHPLYFAVSRPHQPRLVLCVHPRGAWLLNDQGKTVENMLALGYASDPQANTES